MFTVPASGARASNGSAYFKGSVRGSSCRKSVYRGRETVAVYVLHIEPPYQHAAHYIGYTSRPEVETRVAEHLAGRGSPLIRAALAAGHKITIAHKWHCGTREFERDLKNRKETPRLCRLCGPTPRRVTFAAFRRKIMSGGKVRPSRRYYAMAAFAGVPVESVLAMTGEERRALDTKMRATA
jgi:predicted GIY-YIG superfamily endonuclease